MKRNLTALCAVLISVLSLSLRCAATDVAPTDPDFAYVGRISVNPQGNVAFTYPGVQIHALFTGTSVAMLAKPGSGYFMVEIDDREPFKVESVKTSSVVPLASGLADGAHRLTITFANEGHTLKPEFRGLRLDEGSELAGRPELPARKMEFIGNSITCGLGNEGTPADKKFNYSKQNQYYTYEAIAARELNAQCQVVARSGIGIYRNNNGNVTGDKNSMQGVYPYTFFGMTGEKWDFSKYQPDVVCVNLGTNDTTYPRYETSLLAKGFKDFIKTLRGHYPKAKIVLLTGSMLNGQRLKDVQQAQIEAIEEARKAGDTEIYRFDFTPDDGSLGWGMFKHPSARRHARMAEELVPFIREITGWK